MLTETASVNNDRRNVLSSAPSTFRVVIFLIRAGVKAMVKLVKFIAAITIMMIAMANKTASVFLLALGVVSYVVSVVK